MYFIYSCILLNTCAKKCIYKKGCASLISALFYCLLLLLLFSLPWEMFLACLSKNIKFGLFAQSYCPRYRKSKKHFKLLSLKRILYCYRHRFLTPSHAKKHKLCAHARVNKRSGIMLVTQKYQENNTKRGWHTCQKKPNLDFFSQRNTFFVSSKSFGVRKN
jgi:hypothetical protein